MNEITRNLWIGDLPSALDIQQLRKNKIHSVLSVMRGKLKINETFIRHQIELDDTEDADILSLFSPAIHFISAELEKGRGVLVHCLAGISRSPTIVAAYLIYTLNITPDEALGIILEQRPIVQPNQNFSRQLDLFHKSQGKVSKNDKGIRRFYLERTTHEVMNGERSRITTEMLASLPDSPSNSGLATASTSTTSTAIRQRRIRCKMCRQELATREHMLDHGQLAPSTPSLSSDATERPLDCELQPTALKSDLLSSGVTASPRNNTETDGASAFDPKKNDEASLSADGSGIEVATSPGSIDRPLSASRLKGPSDLFSDPKLAASRTTLASPLRHAQSESRQQRPNHLLINPKCSGYFIEPMKWMDHFLSAGLLEGKITCPNKKCNAKLGNYDWAGVCCGCKVWVTPGFCINRSKVDEVV